MMSPHAPALRMPPALLRWWTLKGPNERRIVIALAVLVAAAILWLAIWQPVQRDIATLRVSVPAQKRALAGAQRMADEIAGLSRTPAVTNPPDARADLERVLSQRGLRPLVTQLDWQEGRARLVFAAVPFEQLIQMLEASQRETGLRIVEATLTGRVEPGSVKAELVLAR